MFKRSLTLFSWTTAMYCQRVVLLRRRPCSPCETAWISVVWRMGSSGSMRPLVSTKCDANKVLISVDLPKPVWPGNSTTEVSTRAHAGRGGLSAHQRP